MLRGEDRVAQRRHHYEKAFEDYLRTRRIPYVAVDEAKKALLPEGAVLTPEAGGEEDPKAIKSFDFVLYGQGSNLLVEVKGRRLAPAKRRKPREGTSSLLEAPRRPSRGRLDSWVTLDDIASLKRWESLFGAEFAAALVFVYWCDAQPPDALFEEIFENRGRWYAIRAVLLADYAGAMKTRSPRWRTVHVPGAIFDQISHPLAASDPALEGRGGAAQLVGAAPMAFLDPFVPLHR